MAYHDLLGQIFFYFRILDGNGTTAVNRIDQYSGNHIV